jgi:hypothetical protein
LQDDDWFLFWLDIIGLVRQCFDYRKNQWIHLPFDGGVFDQADRNPYLWSAINYIIVKEKGLLPESQTTH